MAVSKVKVAGKKRRSTKKSGAKAPGKPLVCAKSPAGAKAMQKALKAVGKKTKRVGKCVFGE